MGEPQQPRPVKLVCALLGGRTEWLDMARTRLAQELGPVDMESNTWAFDHTSYYEDEMGDDLLRRFYSFQDLIDPENIVELKHATNRMEKELAEDIEGGPERPLNLDPGYVELSKFVLATVKNYSHRVYLRSGIYAESTLRWQNSRYEPWEWTYPDYCTEEYREFLAKVREKYAHQLRERAADT
jgi:hypothetical protein